MLKRLKSHTSQTNLLIRNFTVHTNQHFKMSRIIQGKQTHYDANVHGYDDTCKAYLQKRWTTKQEIWPKMYIQDPVPNTESSLATQSLVYMKNRLDLKNMEALAQRGIINSQYIISCNLEEHFKPFLDTVLDRVVMNGDVPQMAYQKQNEELQDKSVKLFRRFFYGDDLTDLEVFIEKQY